MQLRRRVPSFILPLVTALAVCGAYFSGHYVGNYDASKRYAVGSDLAYAANCAHELRLLSAAEDLLRSSKYSEAIELLHQTARFKVEAVTKCLGAESCANLVAPTKESRDALLRAVAAHNEPV